VVERADVYGTFGNYIRIRHASGYQTIYGHLSRFARGIRAGAKVSQGQIIAYVGMTGESTGPHLHYEIHKNGDAINPLKLDAPTGRMLLAKEKPAFQTARTQIDTMRGEAVAANAPLGDVRIAGEAPAEGAPDAPSGGTAAGEL
jgi:hypothetical protein